MMLKAKARYSYGTGRIIVDDCPYCHRTHYHNHPIDSGQRMADCFQGEYILDFEESAQSEQEAPKDGMDDCTCKEVYVSGVGKILNSSGCKVHSKGV